MRVQNYEVLLALILGAEAEAKVVRAIGDRYARLKWAHISSMHNGAGIGLEEDTSRSCRPLTEVTSRRPLGRRPLSQTFNTSDVMTHIKCKRCLKDVIRSGPCVPER